MYPFEGLLVPDVITRDHMHAWADGCGNLERNHWLLMGSSLSYPPTKFVVECHDLIGSVDTSSAYP